MIKLTYSEGVVPSSRTPISAGEGGVRPRPNPSMISISGRTQQTQRTSQKMALTVVKRWANDMVERFGVSTTVE